MGLPLDMVFALYRFEITRTEIGYLVMPTQLARHYNAGIDIKKALNFPTA